MPELPEVEIVRRGLASALEGARIVRARAHRADLRFPFPERFEARVTGARVEGLGRRGKHLLAALDTGETLIWHLGMSGRFMVEGPADAPSSLADGRYFARPADPAHTHASLETDRGARILYNDPRRFGYAAIAETAGLAAHPFFRNMGPEPLGRAFTPRALEAALAGRRQSVKASLLDQRIVAGLGNIYVCEALYRARLSPVLPAGEVRGARAVDLCRAVKSVLKEAIAAGGSTLKDFAHADGFEGAFQQRFDVYDRQGQPCPSCKGAIARMVQHGRSTFYCGACQA